MLIEPSCFSRSRRFEDKRTTNFGEKEILARGMKIRTIDNGKLIIGARLRCRVCGWSGQGNETASQCPTCGDAVLASYLPKEGDSASDWRLRFASREPALWKYREFLPIKDRANIATKGEGYTPLVLADRLGAEIGIDHLYIKDERQGPTGSFKDQQASVGVPYLKEQGISNLVIASAGNAGIAYAAYCAQVGIGLRVFFPGNVPDEKVREVRLYGGNITVVDGTYDDAMAEARRFAQDTGQFLDSGVKSFTAVASMQTIAFELSEQLSWNSPDGYIQAVSGGLGPIGVFDGFNEFCKHGLINRIPSIGIVQSAGCSPICQGLANDQAIPDVISQPNTSIATLATGDPGIAYPILKEIISTSRGTAESCTDSEAFEMMHRLARLEGVSAEPATAVAFAGLAVPI